MVMSNCSLFHPPAECLESTCQHENVISRKWSEMSDGHSGQILQHQFMAAEPERSALVEFHIFSDHWSVAMFFNSFRAASQVETNCFWREHSENGKEWLKGKQCVMKNFSRSLFSFLPFFHKFVIAILHRALRSSVNFLGGLFSAQGDFSSRQVRLQIKCRRGREAKLYFLVETTNEYKHQFETD